MNIITMQTLISPTLDEEQQLNDLISFHNMLILSPPQSLNPRHMGNDFGGRLRDYQIHAFSLHFQFFHYIIKFPPYSSPLISQGL